MASWQITGNKFDFSVTHSVAASKDTVYRVLADMEAYPEFVNDLVSVKREGDLYHFTARAAILTIPATLSVTKTPGRSIAFELVDGPLDVLTGRWLIEDGDTPAETRATLTIHVETGPRGEWLLRMTAKYMENKTDKLIAAFSQRAVELERSGGAPIARPVAAEADGFMARLKRLRPRIFGKRAVRAPAPQGFARLALFRDEHHLQTLEALATTMLPADDFDDGVRNLGFVSVVETRARYEAGRQELYLTALEAVDRMAQTMFGKSGFVDLTPAERATLLDAVRQDTAKGDAWGQVKPSSFFNALWEDTVFLYCTHPDTWQRIGFPGPAYDAGGYRDYDQPQAFAGESP